MKAFLSALTAVVVLAVGAAILLPDLFARSSDRSFATENTRVGKEASIAERNFSGRPGREPR